MTARKITANGNKTVKAPQPLKSAEREFGEAIMYMVDQMQTRFSNTVLKEMSAGTVGKFADAQAGNFAAIFLGMAKKFRKKMLKQFDDDRLDELAKKHTGRTDKRHSDEFYSRISQKIGISKEEMESSEGLTFQINAYKIETAQWIKKMRDDTMQEWTSGTLRQMAEGKGLPEIMSKFDGIVEKRKGHAKMIARTQISTFNSLTTKARAQNLGIEKAIWRTAKDERVRGNPGGKYPNAKPSHWDLEGKEFELSKGLLVNGQWLLPGISPNCRCDYELKIPDSNE
jgi:hypothetical protein